MRLSETGRKIYNHRGMEGYSIGQINWALKIKHEIGLDFWMRKQAGELSEQEIERAMAVMTNSWAGWWIQRKEWTIWRHLRGGIGR
jgi:hypothetical protein